MSCSIEEPPDYGLQDLPDFGARAREIKQVQTTARVDLPDPIVGSGWLPANLNLALPEHLTARFGSRQHPGDDK